MGAANLYANPNAKEIYNKTTKILTLPQVKFEVSSIMKSQGYVEKQVFSVARREQSESITSLICFNAPRKIKDTAIRIHKHGVESQTAIYFPALGRIRLIPKESQNEEAFGLGISFSELQNNTEGLSLLVNISDTDGSYYQLVKMQDGVKTLYTIDVHNFVLKKMDIYNGGTLQKEITIDSIKQIGKNSMITKWHIQDYIKDKTTFYTINEQSIEQSFKQNIFTDLSLMHCN